MKLKKLLALLLTVVLLVASSVVALPVNAGEGDVNAREAAASKWDGTVYNDGNYTLKGEGTEASPYLLESAEDVAKFASNVTAGNKYEGKYIKLTCDLNFQNNQWKGIGQSGTNYFAGNFDGDYHVIYNFNLVNIGNNGFFGFAGYGAVITNIGIESGNVTSNANCFAALIGLSKGNLTVDNCYNKANISFTAQGSCGGLIGRVLNPATAVRSITNCYNTGNITVTSPAGKTNPNYSVGGLVAYLTDGVNTVDNCYNTGAITINSYGTAGTNQDTSVGGLIGSNNWPGGPFTMTNCANSGVIAINYEEGGTLPVNVGALIGFTSIHQKPSVNDTNSYVGTTYPAVGVTLDGYTFSAKNVASVTVPVTYGSFIVSPLAKTALAQTKVDDGAFCVRFAYEIGIDSYDYISEVGIMVVSINHTQGGASKATATNVELPSYSLYSSLNYTDNNGDPQTSTPTNGYYIACGISGVPSGASDTVEFVVKPYVQFVDGTVAYGTECDITFTNGLPVAE